MTPANPQEQLDQFPPDWRLIERLAEHGFSLPMVVERPTQVAPDGSRALTLDGSVPMEPQAVMVGREFAHIHSAPVGSMHLMLPQAASELALGKRWVLRHPFAVRGWGPEGTVFVFAPRDEHELEWAKALLSVSHAWASGAVAESSAEAPAIVRPPAQST
ncbi:MAG: hypothetical protein JNJ89_18065 [Rubrivivax sp.]|nr:hypothetical protein [Rubrivivax sp.]